MRHSERIVMAAMVGASALLLGGASALHAGSGGARTVFCENDKCFGGVECRDVGTGETGCQVYGPFGAFCRTYDCDAT